MLYPAGCEKDPQESEEAYNELWKTQFHTKVQFNTASLNGKRQMCGPLPNNVCFKQHVG